MHSWSIVKFRPVPTLAMMLGGCIWLAALIALLFDFSVLKYFRGKIVSSTPPIASLAAADGDVRFQQSILPTWNTAIQGTQLSAGDAVFTGSTSKARVEFLDQSVSIELAPESLVVVRKLQGNFEVELKRGFFIANLSAPESKLTLRRDKKATSITASSPSSRIAVEAGNNATLTVLQGSAEITSGTRKAQIENGATMSAVTMTKPAAVAPRLVAPAPGIALTADQLMKTTFSWRQANENTAKSPVNSIVQVATDVTFASPTLSVKTVNSSLQIPALGDGILFWRVGAVDSVSGDVIYSAPRQLEVLNDEPPQLYQPANGERFNAFTKRSYASPLNVDEQAREPSRAGQSKNAGELAQSAVFFEWEDLANSATYQLEIANDEKFANMVRKVSVPTPRATVVDLPQGSYYWRVLTDLANGRKTRPSSVFSFKLVALKDAPAITAGQTTKQLFAAKTAGEAALTVLRPIPTGAKDEWHRAQIPQVYPAAVATPSPVRTIPPPAPSPTPRAPAPVKKINPVVEAKPKVEPTPTEEPAPLLDAPDVDEEQLIEFKPGKKGAWRRPVLRYLLSAVSLVGTAYADTTSPPAADAALLRWKEVVGAVGYYLEIAREKEFVNIVTSASTTTPEYSWVSPPEGRFYFRVAAVDKLQRKGRFSKASRLTIRRDQVKETPKAIVTGADELEPPAVTAPRAEQIVEVKDDTLVTFSWVTQVEATGYEIEIASTAEFAKAEHKKQTNTQLTTVALKPGKWFWRIRSTVKDGGKGAWSDAIPFTVAKAAAGGASAFLKFAEFTTGARFVNHVSRFDNERQTVKGTQKPQGDIYARYTYKGFGGTVAVGGNRFSTSEATANLVHGSVLMTAVHYFEFLGSKYGAAASLGYMHSPLALVYARNLSKPKIAVFSGGMGALGAAIYKDLWGMGEFEVSGVVGKASSFKGVKLKFHQEVQANLASRFLIGERFFWGLGGSIRYLQAEGAASNTDFNDREFIASEQAVGGWVGGGVFF